MEDSSKRMPVQIGNSLTMSSREIAELTEKEHKNVKRDIEKMLSDLGGNALKFERIYRDSRNREQTEYHLDRDHTETLILGYSAELRLRVVRRLRELEGEAAKPRFDLNDPSSLRALLLDNVNKVIELQGEVEEMREGVEALDRIAESHGTFNRTVAAKNLGVSPNVLIRWMRTNGWTYRRPGTSDDLAYQSKIASGCLEHKITTGPRPDGTEWSSTQVRVTAKGLTILAKAFPKPMEPA
ncbi:phage regulatory protein/antirepressor Ant [Aliirhizobium cellulosilyticum]|uniref:Phage regulator Rha-like protein n=1 Tax=Aliirhizobium cellulosilyticum TaxID=393664 RepID=A0A7W6UU06_9HYPH|nr:phage regulatory protein/antirepressor Ant [Rhizobium cellulosilyticum]MBB4347938.1 phage regulator Rha-like protein [Rhizobium cellulosilyticum]MBB4409668.1 phage regulator Rha-like protein [Rhizobium cellulosilyticum]MBB4444355.1 phage regulator Rha-like protein [Rhizobium cellulosilyticum]